MNIVKKSLKTLVLAASIASATTAFAGHGNNENTSELLSANFESRQVNRIEAGDFHFEAGQTAPVHSHQAPAVGYVVKGQILYQVEGEKPQLLSEGDAFYEPAGKRILRFDNASATDEVAFVNFNLQQEGEPYIVLETALSEYVDRRTLPTTELKSQEVTQVDVFISDLKPNTSHELANSKATLAYVAEGVVRVKARGNSTEQYQAGETFSLVEGVSRVTVDNTSTYMPAKVVAFYLR